MCLRLLDKCLCWCIGAGGWIVVSGVVDFLVCCLGVSVRFAVGFMLVSFRVAIVFAVFVVWLRFAVLCGFVACCLRL